MASDGAPSVAQTEDAEQARWKTLLDAVVTMAADLSLDELLRAVADGAFDDAGYRRLRLAVAALGAPFRGFGDMTVQEVAEVTGLGPEAAALARKRAYSEPGIWRGTDAALERFLSALSARGISARRGGRFLTLSWGGSKAGRMAELVARLRPEVTVALGDAPNDAEMLAAADWAVVVRNEHGPGVAHRIRWRL